MISFHTLQGRFNFRVAAVFIRTGHVLLQTWDTIDFWVLPGGRVEMGEPTAVALEREMEEELGVPIRIGRPLWVMENFFTHEGERWHELCFYYQADPAQIEHLALDREHLRSELDGTPMYFRWFPLYGLSDVRLLPSFLREALQDLPDVPQITTHVDPDLA